MKKPITKRKVSISIDNKIYDFLEKFENKSKYIEYLIHNDVKNSGLLKKGFYL